MKYDGDGSKYDPFVEQVKSERMEARKYLKSGSHKAKVIVATICFVLFIAFIVISITVQQNPFLILGLLSGIVGGIIAVIDKERSEPHENVWKPQSFQLPSQEDYDNYYRYMDAIKEVYKKDKS